MSEKRIILALDHLADELESLGLKQAAILLDTAANTLEDTTVEAANRNREPSGPLDKGGKLEKLLTILFSTLDDVFKGVKPTEVKILKADIKKSLSDAIKISIEDLAKKSGEVPVSDLVDVKKLIDSLNAILANTGFQVTNEEVASPTQNSTQSTP